MPKVMKIQQLVKMVASVLTFFWVLAIPLIAQADTLIPQKISPPVKLTGKIIALKDGSVTVLLNDGSMSQIKWTEVSQAAINDRVTVTLTSGETIMGLFTLDGPDATIISPTLGSLRVAKDKIQGIGRKKREMFPQLAQAKPKEMAAVRGTGPSPGPEQPKSQEVESAGEAQLSEAQAAPTPKKKEVPSIGVKPEERMPEEAFLRREKVLLPAGSVEAEAGIAYGENSPNSLLGFRDRSLVFPLTTRLGVTDKLLGFVTVPLAVSWREIPGLTKSTIQQLSGLGDIRFGLQYQLLTERAIRPDLMFFLAARANTGKSPYNVPLNEAPLGSGHWQIESGLSLVKTFDPVVFFGSLSYTHYFANQDYQPGDAINPVLGTGFALNDAVAMSFRVLGSYIFRSRAYGREVGRVLTPFSFIFTVDTYLTKNSYLEPSVSIGLTDEAPDFTAMLLYVHRFSLW